MANKAILSKIWVERASSSMVYCNTFGKNENANATKPATMILVKSSSNLKTDLLKEYKECPANNKPNVKINKKPNVVSLMMSGTKPNTSAKATIIKPNVPNNKNNLCDFNSIYLIYPKMLFLKN